MRTIAIVGTGIMGSGMALNFLAKGYPVVVWNRTPEKLAPLIKKGAAAASTPREAANVADIVFEVTADDDSSREVWLGENGILDGAKKGAFLITSGTFSVRWVDELARLCVKKGHIYFDMPLTGGRVGAETGRLTFLVGGDEKALKEITPELGAVSEKILYFGPAGSGARYKLILNMLQAIHLVGFGDAMKLAQSAGMDLKKVGDALAERPGGTVSELARRAYEAPPDPINFSVQWIAKDLRYAKEFADFLDLALLKTVLQEYEDTIKEGHGEDDWTEVMKV